MAALSWVKSNSHRLRLVHPWLDQDVHIHFPAGAIAKDGPSAGAAITTALVSLFSDVPVREHLAMTGEVTLRGMILPVGGIKEKLLAAHRAGIRTVILPERNEKDVLADLPLRVRQDFKLHYVSKMDQVLEHAFAVSVLNQESWTADVAAKL